MTPDPVQVYKALSGLRHVRRFQRLPAAVPQSVADHCYYAALIAGCFARQLRKLGIMVDRAAVIEGALWHDAAEAVTGDIPHDFKRWSEAPDLFDVWDRAEHTVLDKLAKLNDGLPRALSKSGEDDLEHLLIKLADWVELLLYVDSEAKLGNHTMDIAAHRIWILLDGKMALAFSRCSDSRIGVLGWYANLLDSLREKVPSPINPDPHDPLRILEDKGGDD